MLTLRFRAEKDRKEWALVSRKVNPKTGKRRVLYWFGTRKPSEESFKEQERRVQYFKHANGNTAYVGYLNKTFRVELGDKVLLLNIEKIDDQIKLIDQKTGLKYKIPKDRFDALLLDQKRITVLANQIKLFK